MKKYDEYKYYRMMKKQQMIYTQQLKRLSISQKRANIILIYYSGSLIFFSIIIKFYPNLLYENSTAFFNIILSIVTLIYSIINTYSRFPERIGSVEKAMDNIKTLKRRLGGLELIADPGERKKEFDDIKSNYETIIDDVEYRDDLDFYHTVKILCEQYDINIKNGKDKKSDNNQSKSHIIEQGFTEAQIDMTKSEIKCYIAEIHPKVQEFHIKLDRARHIFLYLLPVAIFVLCFADKQNAVQHLLNNLIYPTMNYITTFYNYIISLF